jgi:hypothetical protein
LERIGDPRALPALERVAREDNETSESGRIADLANHAIEAIKQNMNEQRG